MKLNDSKLLKFLFWILTRTGVAYFVLAMAVISVVDVKVVWGNAMVRSFNRLMPSFSDLIDYVVSDRKLSDEQWMEYIRYYKRVADLASEDGAGIFFLAFCQTQVGKEKEALRHFQTAVEQVPGLFWFQYDLAVALYNRGNYAGAIHWFQKVIDFGPERMRHYMYDSKLYRQVVGRAYEMGHDVDQELLLFSEKSHLLIAKSWYRLGKYDHALSVIQYGLSQGFGRDKDFYLMAALSLKKLGRYSQAASVLSSYLEAYPGDTNALNELERLLVLSGHPEAAMTVRDIKNTVSEKIGLEQEDIFHKETYKLF